MHLLVCWALLLSTLPVPIRGVYIPPQQPCVSYSRYTDDVDESLLSGATFCRTLLLEDFNFPVDWFHPNPIYRYRAPSCITEMAATDALSQINTEFNMRAWSDIRSYI